MVLNKKHIMDELVSKQRKIMLQKRKLNYSDMSRIIKYVDKSLFDDVCCLWKGYVCCFNKNKNYYINFFFGGKKIQINRLLYENYIGDVEKDEIIKNICASGGKCCNVFHYGKFKINEDINIDTDSNSDSDYDNDNDNNDNKNNDNKNNKNNDNKYNDINNNLINNIDEFKIIF
jgi:hypothetical protein